VAMEALQLSYGVLGRSAFTPGFAVNDSPVRVAPRSFRVSSAARGLRTRDSGGLTWRRIGEDVKGGRDARSVTTRAALLRGLGGSLKSGYVLRHHEIVDEHSEVDTSGDVIEKLKNGFKNFKKTEYKYVPSPSP
jgi:hypothetical protein